MQSRSATSAIRQYPALLAATWLPQPVCSSLTFTTAAAVKRFWNPWNISTHPPFPVLWASKTRDSPQVTSADGMCFAPVHLTKLVDYAWWPLQSKRQDGSRQIADLISSSRNSNQRPGVQQGKTRQVRGFDMAAYCGQHSLRLANRSYGAIAGATVRFSTQPTSAAPSCR